MCKFTYTQHSCSCKLFLHSPQYCAAALAHSSPPREPWVPLFSIAESGYEDYDLILNYGGDKHLQAEKLFAPVLKCEKVELVQEGKDWWCEFHSDPHFGPVASDERRKLAWEEREKREKEEKKKEKKSLRRVLKKMGYNALFSV